MSSALSALVSGEPTVDVVSFAWRVFMGLIVASICVPVAGHLAPKWCHATIQIAVILSWLGWGAMCAWFMYALAAPLLEEHSLSYIKRTYLNELGPFGAGFSGAMAAGYMGFHILRGTADATDG